MKSSRINGITALAVLAFTQLAISTVARADMRIYNCSIWPLASDNSRTITARIAIKLETRELWVFTFGDKSVCTRNQPFLASDQSDVNNWKISSTLLVEDDPGQGVSFKESWQKNSFESDQYVTFGEFFRFCFSDYIVPDEAVRSYAAQFNELACKGSE